MCSPEIRPKEVGCGHQDGRKRMAKVAKKERKGLWRPIPLVICVE